MAWFSKIIGTPEERAEKKVSEVKQQTGIDFKKFDEYQEFVFEYAHYLDGKGREAQKRSAEQMARIRSQAQRLHAFIDHLIRDETILRKVEEHLAKVLEHELKRPPERVAAAHRKLHEARKQQLLALVKEAEAGACDLRKMLLAYKKVIEMIEEHAEDYFARMEDKPWDDLFEFDQVLYYMPKIKHAFASQNNILKEIKILEQQK